MEIKKGYEIYGEINKADSFLDLSNTQNKRWVAVDDLIKWLDDNEEMIYTRDMGSMSEEKRRMIWKGKLLTELLIKQTSEEVKNE